MNHTFLNNQLAVLLDFEASFSLRSFDLIGDTIEIVFDVYLNGTVAPIRDVVVSEDISEVLSVAARSETNIDDRDIMIQADVNAYLTKEAKIWETEIKNRLNILYTPSKITA